MRFSLPRRRRFDLLWQLVKTNFKMRYQNSLLGILWVVIKPYTTFVVMYTIWSSFGGAVIPNYVLYLLVGIIFYTYFNELIVFGQMALLDRASILLKVNFPKQIVVVSALVSALINLGINMVLVFIIALASGVRISLAGLGYFVILATLVFTFALGLSFFLSIFTVRFRDLKNIFELGLYILLWASPVFYVIDSPKLNNILVDIVTKNPVGIVLNQVRAALGIYGTVNLRLILVYFAVSALFALLGWKYFNHKVKEVAEFF